MISCGTFLKRHIPPNFQDSQLYLPWFLHGSRCSLASYLLLFFESSQDYSGLLPPPWSRFNYLIHYSFFPKISHSISFPFQLLIIKIISPLSQPIDQSYSSPFINSFIKQWHIKFPKKYDSIKKKPPSFIYSLNSSLFSDHVSFF